MQWRYKQPHCFLCGFNHPLERDNRKDGGDVGKAIVDIEMEGKEVEMEFRCQYDVLIVEEDKWIKLK